MFYTQVLTAGTFDGSALMMISGDLGNNGQIPLIIELVEPVYDEHKHDPMAGINLLRAYQELGQAAEGEALLARLYALGFAPIKKPARPVCPSLPANAQAGRPRRAGGS
nr:hypothetical protein GCM10020185_18090 [Pseudomonas brassicacearum subsp. brassicacearum]